MRARTHVLAPALRRLRVFLAGLGPRRSDAVVAGAGASDLPVRPLWRLQRRPPTWGTRSREAASGTRELRAQEWLAHPDQARPGPPSAEPSLVPRCAAPVLRPYVPLRRAPETPVPPTPVTRTRVAGGPVPRSPALAASVPVPLVPMPMPVGSVAGLRTAAATTVPAVDAGVALVAGRTAANARLVHGAGSGVGAPADAPVRTGRPGPADASDPALGQAPLRRALLLAARTGDSADARGGAAGPQQAVRGQLRSALSDLATAVPLLRHLTGRATAAGDAGSRRAPAGLPADGPTRTAGPGGATAHRAAVTGTSPSSRGPGAVDALAGRSADDAAVPVRGTGLPTPAASGSISRRRSPHAHADAAGGHRGGSGPGPSSGARPAAGVPATATGPSWPGATGWPGRPPIIVGAPLTPLLRHAPAAPGESRPRRAASSSRQPLPVTAVEQLHPKEPLAGSARTGRSSAGSAGARPASPAAKAWGLRRSPGSLAQRPPSGPVVDGPVPTAGLRVLGAGAAVPGPAPEAADAVTATPPPESPVVRRRSPSDRWATAVFRRPLEVPQPLPAPLHALSRAVTGRRDPVRYTTGPATRHALDAAGAVGAITGDVVHLSTAPTSERRSVAVLAHELSHARTPVLRPRFLLHGHDDSPDSEERQAIDVGRGIADRTGAAGLVDGLPVGGTAGSGPGGLAATMADIARRTVQSVLLGGDGGPAAAALPGDAARGTRTGAPAASVPPAGPDLLPGGAGAAAASPAGGTPSGTDGTAAAGAAPAAAGTAGATGAAGTAPVLLDMDKVVEALEERLLAELERRGGRWAGVF